MPLNYQDRQSRGAQLRTRLEALRTIFPSGGQGETFCALFDEFVENREFGLALEVLCDFLLEPDVRPVTETELNEIGALHVEMEVDDQCFLRLRDKRQNSPAREKPNANS
jgi:hypothetical protein